MKTLMLALLFSVSAFAYNTSYEKAEFTKRTVVKSAKNNSSPKVVSVLIETKTKDGARPVVTTVSKRLGQSDSGCAHKQTLINYSAYNRQTKMFEITYEIQFDVKANRRNSGCTFYIMPTRTSTLRDAASIVIL